MPVHGPSLRSVDALLSPGPAVCADFLMIDRQGLSCRMEPVAQRELGDRGGFDGLGGGGVVVVRVVHEVGALHGAPADAVAEVLGDHALARVVVAEFRGQGLLALLPLLDLVGGDGQVHVLVVAAVARLQLGLADYLLELQVVDAVVALAAPALMELFRDGEAVGTCTSPLHRRLPFRLGSLQGPHSPSALRLPLTGMSIFLARPLQTSSVSSARRCSLGNPALQSLGSFLSWQWAKGSRGPLGVFGRCTWCCFICCSRSTSSSRYRLRQASASIWSSSAPWHAGRLKARAEPRNSGHSSSVSCCRARQASGSLYSVRETWAT